MNPSGYYPGWAEDVRETADRMTIAENSITLLLDCRTDDELLEVYQSLARSFGDCPEALERLNAVFIQQREVLDRFATAGESMIRERYDVEMTLRAIISQIEFLEEVDLQVCDTETAQTVSHLKAVKTELEIMLANFHEHTRSIIPIIREELGNEW